MNKKPNTFPNRRWRAVHKNVRQTMRRWLPCVILVVTCTIALVLKYTRLGTLDWLSYHNALYYLMLVCGELIAPQHGERLIHALGLEHFAEEVDYVLASTCALYGTFAVPYFLAGVVPSESRWRAIFAGSLIVGAVLVIADTDTWWGLPFAAFLMAIPFLLLTALGGAYISRIRWRRDSEPAVAR